MPRPPDLVTDNELRTSFEGPFTVHHYDYSDDENDARSSPRSEYWKVVRQLATGGFGEVWLQECTEGQRRPGPPDLRAVKVIRRVRSGNSNLGYTNELEAIAKFSQKRYSKCFVKFLGWYKNTRSLFIAMEYFPLGDLQKHMSNNEPMPESDAGQVVAQILEGLCFMHHQGFAHRDVKPGNILIKARPPEREWWVKLSDFGITKRIEESAQVQSTIKGTPPYMAPELLMYEPGTSFPVNHQLADMWAVGDISFRMLTKTAAFQDLPAVNRYLLDPRLWSFPSKQLDGHHASIQANSFIRSLLTQHDQRLSADKALEHAWIRAAAVRPATGPRPETTPSHASTDAWATSVLSSDLRERGLVHTSSAETGTSNGGFDSWATVESTSGFQLLRTPRTYNSGPGPQALAGPVALSDIRDDVHGDGDIERDPSASPRPDTGISIAGAIQPDSQANFAGSITRTPRQPASSPTTQQMASRDERATAQATLQSTTRRRKNRKPNRVPVIFEPLDSRQAQENQKGKSPDKNADIRPVRDVPYNLIESLPPKENVWRQRVIAARAKKAGATPDRAATGTPSSPSPLAQPRAAAAYPALSGRPPSAKE